MGGGEGGGGVGGWPCCTPTGAQGGNKAACACGRPRRAAATVVLVQAWSSAFRLCRRLLPACCAPPLSCSLAPPLTRHPSRVHRAGGPRALLLPGAHPGAQAAARLGDRHHVCLRRPHRHRVRRGGWASCHGLAFEQSFSGRGEVAYEFMARARSLPVMATAEPLPCARTSPHEPSCAPSPRCSIQAIGISIWASRCGTDVGLSRV